MMKKIVAIISSVRAILSRLSQMNINHKYIEKTKDEHMRKYGMYFVL
jgi:hypothetical protein